MMFRKSPLFLEIWSVMIFWKEGDSCPYCQKGTLYDNYTDRNIRCSERCAMGIKRTQVAE